jgi:hypothetical protein
MKRTLTKEEMMDIIKHCPEQDKYDWKRNINISTDEAKAELAKDVIAITNAHGDIDGYIIYGVNPNLEDPFVGIDNSYDDASIQQIVNSKITKNIRFLYFEQIIETKRIGIITIEGNQIRPFIVKEDYHVLKAGTTPIRRGSSTDFADERDFQLMMKDPQRLDNIAIKTSYIQKIIYDEAPVGLAITEYLELMKMQNDQEEIEWATRELKGYPTRLEIEEVDRIGVQYRRVNGYFSIADIQYSGFYTFDQIRLQKPDYFWEWTMFFSKPIMELENMFMSDSQFGQIKVPTKDLIEQGFPKGIKKSKILHFYFKKDQVDKILTGVRQRILSKLV